MYDKQQQAHLHYRRGRVLEQSGRVTEAVDAYRQALSEDPQLRAAHMALAAYYTRNGLTTKAIKAWEAALEIDVDSHALGQLAALLIDLQRFDEAHEVLDECIEWWPDDSFCQFQKAYLDYQQNMFQAAHERLIDLRTWQQASWQVHHLLGCCQLKLDDYDGAMASFNRGMLLAQTREHSELIRASMDVISRLREFPIVITTKEQLYVDYGVVYLGTSNDDGLDIDEYQPFTWSLQQIITVFERFETLAQALELHIRGVMALNRVAEPLAQAFAQVHQLDYYERIPDKDQRGCLVICARIRQPQELLAIRDAIPQAIVLITSLEYDPHINDPLPDVVGVKTSLSRFAWEQDLQALREQAAMGSVIQAHLATHTQALVRAWQTHTPEDNLDQQARWYVKAHQRHRLFLQQR